MTSILFLCEVRSFLRYLEPLVKRLYPPLAPRLGRWQRRQRAQRVALLLQEAVAEPRERLWMDIREPGGEAQGAGGEPRQVGNPGRIWLQLQGNSWVFDGLMGCFGRLKIS